MNVSQSTLPDDKTAQITRGVTRLFYQLGENSLLEFTLKTGRRIDVMNLDKKGVFTAVEVKSSVSDFRADTKWQEYLPYCDRFYFAVGTEFPLEILPDDCGLIIADAFGGEIIRDAAPGTMNAARRKALTLRFANKAAQRLRLFTDPPLSV